MFILLNCVSSVRVLMSVNVCLEQSVQEMVDTYVLQWQIR